MMYQLGSYLCGILFLAVLVLLQSVVHADSDYDLFLGETTYMNNCAVCHGKDGIGDGPMMSQLVISPSDLTQLSKSNEGSFPENRVYQLIDGRTAVYTDEGLEVETFHGPKDMPIWGDEFRAIEGDEGAVDELIGALIEYLKSIQIK